jgi:hypothetical protein
VRPVDTDALRLVSPALGIGNPSTAVQPVTFDDANLQQVIDVLPLVRRGRVPVGSTGLFCFQLRTVHAAADSTQTFEVNPYTLVQTGGGTVGGLWPNPVPNDLDVWILRVSASLTSGASANFVGGVLDMVMGPSINGFVGGGPLITSSSVHRLATFDDTLDNVLPGTIYLTQAGSGLADLPMGFRLPRVTNLRWRTRNTNATAIEATTTILMGLFGAGLGQDAF